MAKSCHTDVIDGALNIVKNNANKLTVCTAQPLTFADANTNYKLAEVTMAATDYTLAAGVTSGRRATVASKTNFPIATSGTATHVALVDTVGSRLLYVTTCSSTALAAGGNVTTNAWDIEIAFPS